MSKDNGGPAFPTVDYAKPVGGGAHMMTIAGGMTLRDYFAAKAMAALMPVYWDTQEKYSSAKDMINCHVEAAYEYADAMLAERAK